MKNVDWKTVAIAALVALVVVLSGQTQSAHGRYSTDGNNEMIAVTGEYGNGTSVLYVIDTKTRQMAVYRSFNGKSVELVAARRIEHDLKLLSFHDRSDEHLHPLILEKNYKRYLGGTGPAEPDRAKLPETSKEEKK